MVAKAFFPRLSFTCGLNWNQMIVPERISGRIAGWCGRLWTMIQRDYSFYSQLRFCRRVEALQVTEIVVFRLLLNAQYSLQCGDQFRRCEYRLNSTGGALWSKPPGPGRGQSPAAALIVGGLSSHPCSSPDMSLPTPSCGDLGPHPVLIAHCKNDFGYQVRNTTVTQVSC